MFKEFKEFAMRGNVVDMAVGIIIGTAFGKIVSSFVSDVLMPPIGMLLGGMDFGALKLKLKEDVFINYGVFINTVIDFIIIAFAIFLVVNGMNRLKRKEIPPPPAAPTTKECPECLSVIPIKAVRCAHCGIQLK